MPRLLWCFSFLLSVFAAPIALGAQDIHVQVSKQFSGAGVSDDHFPTIQMALDHAARPAGTGRLYLHIAPGVYRERVIVTQNSPRTTMLGMGAKPEDVVIVASQSATTAGGTFFSSTAEIYGPEFEADNLTFSNDAGNVGQAVAITVRSDRAVFKHCRFLGDQDTLFADFGRQYYTRSYVEGGVDFIFGNASAVFDDSEIHVIRPGYIAAQSRTNPEQSTGFVFHDVHITAVNLGDRSFYLGRPWRPYSRVVYISSTLPAGLNPKGWAAWSKGNSIENTFFAEYESHGAGANAKVRMEGARQLSRQEAAGFEARQFLAGADNWNPIAEAANLP